MTQEEKSLLLKDLCARLPYGVKCRQHKLDSQVCTMYPEYLKNAEDVEEYEPYLRPMSSMTEDEVDSMLDEDLTFSFANWELPNYKVLDFLNSHHFDYRDLISKGLALEAPSDM